MAKTPRKPQATEAPAQPTVDGLRRYGGSASQEWNLALIAGTAAATYSAHRSASGLNPSTTKLDDVQAAKAALAALAPGDELDAMLASLAITSHAAAQEALQRAARLPGEHVAAMFKHASSLGRLHLDALAALERRQATRREQAAPKSEAAASSDAPAPVGPPPPPPVMPESAEERFINRILGDDRRGYRDHTAYGYRSTPTPEAESSAAGEG